MSIRDFLFGRPLASEEDQAEKIGPGRGIGIYGLDALGSTAYGPEAALTILLVLGTTGLDYILPITILIIILIFIVLASYLQTISAYPNGGGTYTVASENLGSHLGLFGGICLIIDYTLVVAVGISAGVGALTSVFPQLHPHILSICLSILLLITIINLRGINDSGAIFLIPAYFFIGCLLFVLFFGLWKSIISHGNPEALINFQHATPVQGKASLWLLLKAFSSGCTAMTGIEAVSNGVTTFKDPRIKSARTSLTIIISILIVMLISVAYLCQVYNITATIPDNPEYKSVLYMLVFSIIGNNWFSFLTLASILFVLVFQANTAFTGFPRLCSVMAQDGFLPQGLANKGRRLVYSSGIYILACLSALLLIMFNGVTDRLIPLFAVGAFLAFTISQAGMVKHWIKTKGKHYQIKMALNAIGTITTGITAVIVTVSKFQQGAWVILVLIPALYFFMKRIHFHYYAVEKQVKCKRTIKHKYFKPPIAVIPAEDWNNVMFKALQTALAFTKEIIVVHIKSSEEENNLPNQWQKYIENPLKEKNIAIPKLEVIESPYRLVVTPIVDYILKLEKEFPDRQIAVFIPNLIERKWYQRLLHNQRAILLAGMLMYKSNKRILIIHVPWYLKEEEED